MNRKDGKHRVPLLDMQFVTATISTTLVLLLLGMVLFFVLSARNLSVYVRENICFSLVLADDVKAADVKQLQHALQQQPFVKSVEYISKERALSDYIADTGTDPQEFVGYNPLNASIEIRLQAAYANSDSIARIEKQFGQESRVKEVLYQQELMDAVNRNVGRISLLLLGLAALLLLISFALINNTIKLTIYSQRFLLHAMKLVGASWGFIRRPFLRRHFWIGVLAAAVADGLLWVAALGLVNYEPALVQVVTPEVMVWVSAAVLVAGVGITWLCAWWSVSRYLRMPADALYLV